MPSSSTSSDEYLAIVTTEAKGVYEHKFKKSEPKPNEVVAEVAFAGLNHIDLNQVETGAYVSAFPYVIGKEWSGKIVELGSDVKDLQIGDAIIGFGYKAGALQERITAPRAHVCLKPEKLSFEEGATIPHRYASIFVALFFKQGLQLPLEPSEEQAKYHIVVWGAATGTGMFAIQALKAQGYQKVIAVASLKQKDKLLALGALDVFDRHDAQIAQHIKAKYPGVSLGLVCQIDPDGWTSLLEVVKPDESTKTTPAVIVYIVRSVPPEVPKGVELRRTVVFMLLQDPSGDEILAKYLPKLLKSSAFQVPKKPEVVSNGSLLERTKASLEIARKNTEVSVVIKVD